MFGAATAAQTTTNSLNVPKWAQLGLMFLSYENRTLVSKLDHTCVFSFLFFLLQQPSNTTLPALFVARGARFRIMFDLGRACEVSGFGKGGGGRSLIVESMSIMSGKVIAIGLGGSSQTWIVSVPISG